jgi:phage terminase large subunit-like protein
MAVDVAPQRRGGNNAGKRLADTSSGPWKQWPRGMSRVARAIRFMETYCRPPKGTGWGEPLKLAQFQKEWLEESLADGVDASVLQTPRGNGKSSLGGALATWAVYDDDDTGAPQVPIIATTVGQAIRSCYGVAAAMVNAEPELRKRALIYTGTGTSRINVPANGGDLFPMANDVGGLQGLDYSLAIVDEIGFQPIESWDSLRLASGKRSQSLVAGVGTPGLDRENALFHLRQLVKEGATFPGFVYREYAAPDGCPIDDRAAWRVANPALDAGFLRESALETDLAITPEGHFRTFRLGQWVDGVDCWLGASGSAVWERLTSPYELLPGVPTWVGIDMALVRDTSAVVVMQRRPDKRFHAVCRIWVPTEDRPVDATDVMQHIRDLAESYRVEAISFDPRFFDVPAKMLSDEGLPMFEVPQSVERMTAAVGSLYEAIMGGSLTHDGDPAFETQILNAVPRFSERGFTLEKKKSRGKIDAAIALALAYDQALRHVNEPPSVYEDRELVSV